MRLWVLVTVALAAASGAASAAVSPAGGAGALSPLAAAGAGRAAGPDTEGDAVALLQLYEYFERVLDREAAKRGWPAAPLPANAGAAALVEEGAAASGPGPEQCRKDFDTWAGGCLFGSAS